MQLDVFYWKRAVTSKIIESLRDDLAELHDAGAISTVTMREFDTFFPPPVRELSPDDIKRLPEALCDGVNTPVARGTGVRDSRLGRRNPEVEDQPCKRP